MALQFVLGNSGSGKTKYMFEQIVRAAGKHPTKNYLIIVPEQFTLSTQQVLVDLAYNHAIMNIDVLSFKRLAYRVFDDMGIRDIRILEETGKNLILRKVAQEQEHNLTVLRPNMNRMGYIEELKSFISELVQYNVSCEMLEKYAQNETLPTVFRKKLADIVTMYRGFEAYMQGTYITAEEILNVLITVADKSELLKNSVLVFDEFTGFTPIQNRLLYKILPIVDQMYVLLTIDANENFYRCEGEHELFYMTKKTMESLMRMAEERNVSYLKPIVLSDAGEKRFVKAPALAFMEQHIFRAWYKKYYQEISDIQIASMKNAREELIYVARKINELVHKRGYRYKDIAVVTGAVETYGNYVEEIFTQYEIPYFLDQTTEILFHPFIEFVRSILEVVESKFNYSSVIRFLRCGFCDLSEAQIDNLDNYLIATGIGGIDRWKNKWQRMTKRENLYDLEELNAIRQYVYSLFLPVISAFYGENRTTENQIHALYEMLCLLDSEAKLWEKEQEYLSAGKQAKAKEYGQIYQIVMELFDKFYYLLKEEQLSIEEFTEIFEAGLSAAQVASIPPGYDNVTIGDIERTRLNYIKILFFIGVNDGIVPKNADSSGIISEYERRMLMEENLELAPGAREKAFIQRFYLYRNLTKPSEALYLSFARVDREGKKVRPSYLLDVLKKLFPKLKITEIEHVLDTPDYSTKQAAWDYLVTQKKDEAWYVLAKYFLEQEKNEKLSGKISTEELLKAAYAKYSSEPISKWVAQKIYGNHPQSSVTRLEQFASCAYAHFLRYGLSISEREESGFYSADMGNIYHNALEKFSRYIKENNLNWFTLADKKREELSERALREAVEECSNMSLFDSAEHMHMAERMSDIFKQTTWALTRQVQAGSFEPTGFELSFRALNQPESLKVELEENRRMELLARVDRLDLAQVDDKLFVKIIDYKSGSTKFDLVRIYRGLSLQLVVYMNAAMEYTKQNNPDSQVLPAGILYYNIDDPVIEEKNGEMDEADMEEALLLALRPDGLISSEEEIYRAMDKDFEKKSLVIPIELKQSGEPSERGSHVASTEEFEVIQNYVKEEVARQGKKIYEGDIAVNPYKDKNQCSCNYCPYSAICGINSGIPGYEYRTFENLKKEEVMERMKCASVVRKEHVDGTIMDEGTAKGN